MMDSYESQNPSPLDIGADGGRERPKTRFKYWWILILPGLLFFGRDVLTVLNGRRTPNARPTYTVKIGEKTLKVITPAGTFPVTLTPTIKQPGVEWLASFAKINKSGKDFITYRLAHLFMHDGIGDFEAWADSTIEAMTLNREAMVRPGSPIGSMLVVENTDFRVVGRDGDFFAVSNSGYIQEGEDRTQTAMSTTFFELDGFMLCAIVTVAGNPTTLHMKRLPAFPGAGNPSGVDAAVRALTAENLCSFWHVMIVGANGGPLPGRRPLPFPGESRPDGGENENRQPAEPREDPIIASGGEGMVA
ncbi:MAG: hypothetical protein LBT97_06930 [Planctomycetota bacterium]|jgi:hypothetical protein|nr:hypothetical protein [Planctomycetota bacterium]